MNLPKGIERKGVCMVENQIVVYTGVDRTEIRVLVQNDTVWLTQAQICQLLGRERSVITKHIGNALKEGEVDAESNVQILHIANSDKPVRFYDLDVVISVGYRVKSLQGTLFRRWATRVLREMLLKRLGDLKRIDSLEQRMISVEAGVEQLREGVEYLAQQLEGDTEMPHPRVGFGAKEGELVDKPYGKLSKS